MTTTECSERSRFTVVPVPETELPENPDLGVSRTQLVDSNPEGQNAELCRSCTCRGRRSMSCGSFWWKLLCSVTAVAVFASFGLVYWTVYQREEAAGAGRNLYSRRISSDGQDSVFACHFIDGKVESEEESRETCEVRKNSTMVPYCFSMLKQDERTPSTEVSWESLSYPFHGVSHRSSIEPFLFG